MEPPRKGVIEKMVDLVELLLILESKLVGNATRKILVVWICNITNAFGLTEFGSVMNKL